MTVNNKNKSLIERTKETAIDGVKIAATSGVLAFLGLSKSCSELPAEIGVSSICTGGLQAALMAFDVGAGAFAGYKNRYGASLAVYAATLIPEIHDTFTSGNLEDAAKRVLAKTIVYGGSYGLGYFFRSK